jgi:hypothetical protein
VWTKKIDFTIFPSIARLKATPLQDVQRNLKTDMIAKNDQPNMKKWIELAVGTTPAHFVNSKRKRE